MLVKIVFFSVQKRVKNSKSNAEGNVCQTNELVTNHIAPILIRIR